MQSVGSSRSLSLLLSAMLCGTPCGLAQSPRVEPSAKAKTTAQDLLPSELKLRALEGDNVINSIRLGRSVAPVVEVRDENDLPVEGAAVVFTVPDSGPGGTFPGGAHSFTISTNAQGQATCPFRANSEVGKFKVTVVATSGSRTGQIALTQANSAGGYVGRVVPRKPLYKKWYFWAIIGGAAAAGLAVWATNRSSNTTSRDHAWGAGLRGPALNPMTLLQSQSIRKITFGLAVLIGSCPSFAQASVWNAPSTLYVHDTVGKTIRPLVGVVGSSYPGPVLLDGVDWASLALNHKSALVYRGGILAWVPDLSAPNLIADFASYSLLNVPLPQQVIWASDSTRAVVLAAESPRLVWLGQLNASARVEGSWDLDSSQTKWSLLAADSSVNQALLWPHKAATLHSFGLSHRQGPPSRSPASVGPWRLSLRVAARPPSWLTPQPIRSCWFEV